MTATISAENIKVLHDPAFDTPKVRPEGDFGTFLRDQLDRFFETTRQFSGSLAERLSERADRMHELADTLPAVVEWTRQRRHERAWQCMEGTLDKHYDTLKKLSLQHAHKIKGSRSWYRLSTWSAAKTRGDIFHLPFQMKAKSYRFSPPGRPALYLGNNVYVCWLECLEPKFKSCSVARFKLDFRDNERFLDLPTNHATYLEPLVGASVLARKAQPDPRQSMNAPYKSDVEAELVDYLSVWPLLMAMTVQKLEPAPKDPPEYLIPQLLMKWVLKQKDLVGIRYFTSKIDPQSNSNDVSINVVIPTRTENKAEGFCDFLVDRVRCTPPQPFARAMRIREDVLFTNHAADVRQAAGGRYWINREGSRGATPRPDAPDVKQPADLAVSVLPGVRTTLRKWYTFYNGYDPAFTRWNEEPYSGHYHETPFGRIEYWLDRSEQVVARIDSKDGSAGGHILHQKIHALVEKPQARILLIGVVYAVVGIGFGELANLAPSDQARFIWRLGAWVACAAVYAVHFWYEHFRLYNRTRATSVNAGAAVALGGLLLAVAALAHALTVPTHAPYRLYLVALVVWPVITGVPAFLVAFAFATVLIRLSIKRSLIRYPPDFV